MYPSPNKHTYTLAYVTTSRDSHRNTFVSKKHVCIRFLCRSTLTWNRVIDVNDRFLRSVTIGQGAQEKMPRSTGYDIAVRLLFDSEHELCFS